MNSLVIFVHHLSRLATFSEHLQCLLTDSVNSQKNSSVEFVVFSLKFRSFVFSAFKHPFGDSAPTQCISEEGRGGQESGVHV